MSSESRDKPESPGGPRSATGVRRWLYVGIGLLFVGLGLIGAFVPVLPTTPFLLLASWAFVRSEPRLHRWLLDLPGCGPLVQEWEERRTVSRGAKRAAYVTVAAAIGLSLAFGNLSAPLVALLLGLAAIGLTVVYRLPVTETRPLEPGSRGNPLPPEAPSLREPSNP